jgi:hypothetical protein
MVFIATAALMLMGGGNSIAADNGSNGLKPAPAPTAPIPNCCPSRAAMLSDGLAPAAPVLCNDALAMGDTPQVAVLYAIRDYTVVRKAPTYYLSPTYRRASVGIAVNIAKLPELLSR